MCFANRELGHGEERACFYAFEREGFFAISIFLCNYPLSRFVKNGPIFKHSFCFGGFFYLRIRNGFSQKPKRQTTGGGASWLRVYYRCAGIVAAEDVFLIAQSGARF